MPLSWKGCGDTEMENYGALSGLNTIKSKEPLKEKPGRGWGFEEKL